MKVGMTEAVAFVYTLGVLVTGLWVLSPETQLMTPLRVGLIVGITVAWTAYFSWTIVPRIIDLETEDDEDEDEDEEDEDSGPVDPEF